MNHFEVVQMRAAKLFPTLPLAERTIYWTNAQNHLEKAADCLKHCIDLKARREEMRRSRKMIDTITKMRDMVKELAWSGFLATGSEALNEAREKVFNEKVLLESILELCRKSNDDTIGQIEKLTQEHLNTYELFHS